MKKRDLQALRRRLPRVYTPKALQMLKQRGKVCSAQYVSLQLSRGKDLLVLEVLCDIADAHEAEVNRIARRARRDLAAA